MFDVRCKSWFGTSHIKHRRSQIYRVVPRELELDELLLLAPPLLPPLLPPLPRLPPPPPLELLPRLVLPELPLELREPDEGAGL